MQSQATVSEADTKTLVKELKRRRDEERDMDARRALKSALPRKKEKLRVR